MRSFKKVLGLVFVIAMMMTCLSFAASESGYSWSYIVNNQDIVSISKTYVGDCSNNVDNCDGKDIYEVKGLKEGTAVVTFDYVNENDEVENEAIYEFIVDENLNVSENHYGSYFE